MQNEIPPTKPSILRHLIVQIWIRSQHQSVENNNKKAHKRLKLIK